MGNYLIYYLFFSKMGDKAKDDEEASLLYAPSS